MNTSEAVVCARCNEPVGSDDRFCEGCGALLDADARPDDGRVALDLGSAAGVTHRGKRHRRNEDAMHVAVLDDITVAVVCDGVSTSSQPHLASNAAVDAAGAVLARPGDAMERVDHAVLAAQRAVEQVPWSGRANPGPPACTFVGAVWDGARIVVANVGDSRAYWIGDDESICLTEDDSVARELELRGYEPDQIAASGGLHAIVRWLGRDAPGDPYRVRSFTPSGPGRLIVCSDGLWNYAETPEALAALVRADPGATPADVSHALVDHALRSGGDDNVTVAVVDIHPESGTGDSPAVANPSEELP